MTSVFKWDVLFLIHTICLAVDVESHGLRVEHFLVCLPLYSLMQHVIHISPSCCYLKNSEITFLADDVDVDPLS